MENTKGVSLERINPLGTTADSENWLSAAETVGFATPGYENSQRLNNAHNDKVVQLLPRSFSPDNDGMDDVLNIHFHLPGPGFVVNVYLYSLEGVLIRHLVQNTTVEPEGVFHWNGLNERREMMRMGMYIVLFDAFAPSGKIIREKNVCALVRQPN